MATSAAAPAARSIDATELRRLLDSGACCSLLDVREAGQVETGHVPGATNLPRREFAVRIRDLVPRSTTPVIVCDGGEGLAKLAAADLMDLGYRDVSVLEGGQPAWVAAGGRKVTGRNVPSKGFGELVQQHAEVPTVAPDELAAWVEAGRDVLICDVRTDAEHHRETIPGSVHIPGFELPVAVAELAGPDTTVIVHCSGRTRSIIGTETLRLTGRQRVVALENGTMGWVLAGRDPDRGATRRPAGLPERASEGVRRRWRTLARSVGVGYLPPGHAQDLLAGAERLDRTVQLFDVRLRDRFIAGHAPGALWVPSGQLVQRADDHLAVRGATTLVICDDGVRSSVVAYWLRRMGRNDILVVDGGMGAWSKAGLPIEAAVGVNASEAIASQLVADTPGRDALEVLTGDGPRPTLVSVDSTATFTTEHPDGARWMSATWLERDLDRHIPDRTTPILFVSAEELPSRIATYQARRSGWSDATWLRGGTVAWAAAGCRLVAGAPEVEQPDDHLLHPITLGPAAMRAYLDWEHELGKADGSPA